MHLSRWLGSITFYKPALIWGFTALLVRLSIGLVIHFYSLASGFQGFYPVGVGGDDRFYFESAITIYNGGIPDKVYNDYPYILNGLFQLTTPSLVAGKLLNVLAGALTVYIGILLVKLLCPARPTARGNLKHPVHLVGIFLTFYPSAIFYSTQLLKDSLTVLFGMLALYFSLKLLKQRLPYLWLAWIASLLSLYAFRPYAAAILVLSLSLYLLVEFKQNWRRHGVSLLIATGLAAVVPFLLGKGWFASDYILLWLDPERLSTFREKVYSGGGSSTGTVMDFSSPLGFAVPYLNSYFTTLWGPLPWQLKSLGQAIALPEAALMWLLSPTMLGLFQKNRREEKFLLIFALLLIGGIALFSDNVGASTRLRLLPWSAFFIYAATVLGTAWSSIKSVPKANLSDATDG